MPQNAVVKYVLLVLPDNLNLLLVKIFHFQMEKKMRYTRNFCRCHKQLNHSHNQQPRILPQALSSGSAF